MMQDEREMKEVCCTSVLENVSDAKRAFILKETLVTVMLPVPEAVQNRTDLLLMPHPHMILSRQSSMSVPTLEKMDEYR